MKLLSENNGVYRFERNNGKRVSTTAESEQKARDKIANADAAKPSELEVAKSNKISQIKAEANRKIESQYPKYKQLNYALGIQTNGYDNATAKNEMKTFLKSIIEKSNELETQVNEMTDIDKIKNLEIVYE